MSVSDFPEQKKYPAGGGGGLRLGDVPWRPVRRGGVETKGETSLETGEDMRTEGRGGAIGETAAGLGSGGAVGTWPSLRGMWLEVRKGGDG